MVACQGRVFANSMWRVLSSRSASADWLRTVGWNSMRRCVQTRVCCARSFVRVLRRRSCAAAGDRRAARSLQHEAGRHQRPAGAQRLPADHPSSGRPLDRLYRPSRRHRRYSRRRSIRMTGKAEPNGTSIVDVTDPAQPEISAPHSRPGRQIRSRRRADGAHLRRQGAAQGRSATRSIMLRTFGGEAHEIWNVADPANPVLITRIGGTEGHPQELVGMRHRHRLSGVGRAGLAHAAA